MSAYFPPPDDWAQPSTCTVCDALVIYGPVIGGHMWSHVGGRVDHDVQMGTWWDVSTGTWREGSGLAEILAADQTARQLEQVVALEPIPDQARLVRHWCGKAERHSRHGTRDHGWCNGFGLDAGPGCSGCKDCSPKAAVAR